MPKFYVTCTKIYNGVMEVEADSPNEAMDYASEHLDECEFEYGETTVDYVEYD